MGHLQAVRFWSDRLPTLSFICLPKGPVLESRVRSPVPEASCHPGWGLGRSDSMWALSCRMYGWEQEEESHPQGSVGSRSLHGEVPRSWAFRGQLPPWSWALQAWVLSGGRVLLWVRRSPGGCWGGCLRRWVQGELGAEWNRGLMVYLVELFISCFL